MTGESAWQKQLRDRYNAEGLPPGLKPDMIDLKKAVARRVHQRVARQVILKYEWLGTCPSCTAYYGLFFGDYCSGVTCVKVGSVGANMSANKEWGIEMKDLAYLIRGANVHWSPPGANSKLVSLTSRLLKKDFPNLKLIIAYSDTDAGEVGTIYQACSWVCVGRGAAMWEYLAPDGRTYNMILAYDLARNRGGTRDQWHEKLLADGYKVQETNPKWRYVNVLDRSDQALLDIVESKRVPYPKR